ncbi:FadR/GntR family transcriptional regulator [Sphingopyxis macrogoltabida]|uniref:GntR family transcriptional regulator n=1 Tax=Sphingopyxis macrogoltabida TaxID=33050 RepID=A0AAC8YYX2_SPHMC|nr:FCD domain-containing protein [Sphingopyxis macrogoltabida]ALJ13921.1 GntR family transcriptional regulator [Sphingopyxis macrogoltabida]AMU88642.1 GntR family transcriptional regulator [Sphingopyxis macrogoltabida]
MNEAVQTIDGARGSLVERAMDFVRDHIRDHDLKVGDTLPGEGSFAAEMGVSRPVMREAFGALAALRLVDVGNGRKPRVGAIDGSVMAASMGHAVNTAQVSLADVWEVRRTLELRTAEMAATNRSEEQARAILAAAHGLAIEGDEAARTAADTAFHQTIAAASGNPLFYQIVRSFEELMERAIPRAWQGRTTEAEREETLALHREVAEAIAAREPARARIAMERHFANSVGELLRRNAEFGLP